MDLVWLFTNLKQFFLLPSAILFLVTSIILTLKTKFIQVRGVPKLIKVIKQDIHKDQHDSKSQFSAFHALFTAMATTIGMGNVVGPTLAIAAGGPGALFWLITYAFFASVTKFSEVVFALKYRSTTKSGFILGGPMQYLNLISPAIATWYAFFCMFLFAAWSGVQSNTLAKIFAQEGYSEYLIGFLLAALLLGVLWGGIKRVGSFASKLVPLMFFFYITFALFILLKDVNALWQAIKLVCTHIFNPAAAVGGFLGATIFEAMRNGVYRSIYITEAGIGTSSIAHSLANSRPTDQGLLALYSMAADTFLCLISGLMVLVTGVWQTGLFSPTLIYEVFKINSPHFGKYILIISITLFVLTTVIGNSFNGSQIFAWFTKHRWLKLYYIFVAVITFLGAIAHVPTIWASTDIILTLVAVPNLICLLILAFKRGKDLEC
jgi:alanine or glycine:cation symporter, AGCS family